MSSRWKNAVESVVKNVGSLGNKPEKRLSECLPPADRPICDKDGQLKRYRGWHVFASEFARKHFIKSVLILLSENGTRSLNNMTFDLFFNRAYDGEGNTWYTASIVALEDLAIRNTIMAPGAASTKGSAFQLLILEAEARITTLLRDNSDGSVGRSSASSRTSPVGFRLQQERMLPSPTPGSSVYDEYGNEPVEDTPVSP